MFLSIIARPLPQTLLLRKLNKNQSNPTQIFHQKQTPLKFRKVRVIGHDWESSSSDDGTYPRGGTEFSDWEEETQKTDTHANTDRVREWENKQQSFPVQKEIKKKKNVVSLKTTVSEEAKKTNAV